MNLTISQVDMCFQSYIYHNASEAMDSQVGFFQCNRMKLYCFLYLKIMTIFSQNRIHPLHVYPDSLLVREVLFSSDVGTFKIQAT